MVLFEGEALIVRSSSNIYFFKQEFNKEAQERRWCLYHTIKVRGLIFYMKGPNKMQITTDHVIYFYIINKKTFMPELENVMYNYMGCNQLMFGTLVRFGISYKTNQRSFDIYTRKYMHNLRVCVNSLNLEGATGLELATSNVFLVTNIDKILMFDCDNF